MVSVRCSPRLIPLPGSRTGGTSERAATITVRCSGTGAPERGVPGRGFPAPARCSGSGVGRWGFEGGAASPSPAAMLNIAWAGLTTVQWLKPAPAEPLKRLSGHRSERRTPARRGQAPRPLGRLPRRRRRAASHFWVTARSLPRTAFSPYPVPLGDRRSSIWGDSGARIYPEMCVGRPRVSNDNPYSEAHFKTIKYHPGFPGRLVQHRTPPRRHRPAHP